MILQGTHQDVKKVRDKVEKEAEAGTFRVLGVCGSFGSKGDETTINIHIISEETREMYFNEAKRHNVKCL